MGKVSTRTRINVREAALWGAALVNVLCQGGFSLILRGGGSGSESAGLTLMTIYAIGLSAAVLIAFKALRGAIPRSGLWLLVIYSIPLMCIPLWHDPYQQFRFGVVLTATMWSQFAIALVFDTEDVLEILVRAVALAMLTSVVVALALPSMGRHVVDDIVLDVHAGAWRGIYSHKNEYGQACDLAVIVMLTVGISRFKSRLLYVVVMAASLVGLVLSRSSAAILIPMLAMILAAAFWAGPQNAVIKLLRWPALIFLISTPFTLPLLPAALDLVGRDLTFTGRTVLWSYLLENYGESSLFGHGPAFFSVELYQSISAAYSDSFTDPHNGYIDVYLSYGLFGCGAFALLYGASVNFARKFMASRRPASMIMGRLALFGVLNALLSAGIESTLVRGQYPASAIAFLLISTVFIKKDQPTAMQSKKHGHIGPETRQHRITSDVADVKSAAPGSPAQGR